MSNAPAFQRLEVSPIDKKEYTPEEGVSTSAVARSAERFRRNFTDLFRQLRELPDTKFRLMIQPNADEAVVLWEELLPLDTRVDSGMEDIMVMPRSASLSVWLTFRSMFRERIDSALAAVSDSYKAEEKNEQPGELPVKLH